MAKRQSKKEVTRKSGDNPERNNKKAWKKHPRTGMEGKTGRTVGGYSMEKLAKRAFKRRGSITVSV